MSRSVSVTLEDARSLWRILADGEWRKQKSIPMRGVKVRKVCNEYAPYFISNTQQGYRRTDLATHSEIEHSINDLRSRAKKMLERADKLEQFLYGNEDMFS